MGEWIPTGPGNGFELGRSGDGRGAILTIRAGSDMEGRDNRILGDIDVRLSPRRVTALFGLVGRAVRELYEHYGERIRVPMLRERLEQTSELTDTLERVIRSTNEKDAAYVEDTPATWTGAVVVVSLDCGDARLPFRLSAIFAFLLWAELADLESTQDPDLWG